jgi:hypothetical protein
MLDIRAYWKLGIIMETQNIQITYLNRRQAYGSITDTMEVIKIERINPT